MLNSYQRTIRMESLTNVRLETFFGEVEEE
jgi:hypothetical protein